MSDEQDTAEPTAIDESQEQTPEVEDNGSEADENSSETEGRGDLRVPLKEERTKRQELERKLEEINAKLEDPDFIYERAGTLGMVNEEQTNQGSIPQDNSQVDVRSEVTRQVSIEKARDKYPELRKDEEMQVLVTAMAAKMRTNDFVKAADKVFAKINKANEEAAQKAIEKKSEEEAEQAKAQNVSSTTNQTIKDSELEQINKDLKSADWRTRDQAMLKKIKLKMK